MSSNEIICSHYLTTNDIHFKSEIKLKSLPRKCFDFSFSYLGVKWIIEVDGEQHFQYNSLFHEGSVDRFYQRRQVDVDKTKAAINEGYNVIRIDYVQIKNITYHIARAFSFKEKLYVSTAKMLSFKNFTINHFHNTSLIRYFH